MSTHVLPPALPHPSRASSRRAGSRPLFLSIPLEDLACAALFAFFAMQGSIPGIAPPQALEMTAAAPTALTTIGGIASQALANAVIVLLLLRRPRLLLHQLSSPRLLPLGLLAVLAIASAAWSLDPLLTLRRSIPFALAGLFGLYLAARFPTPRLLAILRLSMMALALATIAVVLFAPSIGLDHSPGHAADWQGVFTQKNACGRIMVLASAAVLFAPPRAARITAARIFSLALFLFVLIMSGSRGAWLIEAALLLLALVLHLARPAGPRVRTLLIAITPLALLASVAIALAALPRLASLIGRDPTLSGRTVIWTQVLHAIAQRPLAGYGYNAFWRGMAGPSFQIAASVHFIVEHAHNGFLEILLELGLAGLALFVLSWLLAMHGLLSPWLRGDLARIAWPLAVLVLTVLYDLDENTLLLYNGLFWPLYVAAVAACTPRDRHHNSASPSRAILTPLPGPRLLRPRVASSAPEHP